MISNLSRKGGHKTSVPSSVMGFDLDKSHSVDEWIVFLNSFESDANTVNDFTSPIIDESNFGDSNNSQVRNSRNDYNNTFYDIITTKGMDNQLTTRVNLILDTDMIQGVNFFTVKDEFKNLIHLGLGLSSVEVKKAYKNKKGLPTLFVPKSMTQKLNRLLESKGMIRQKGDFKIMTSTDTISSLKKELIEQQRIIDSLTENQKEIAEIINLMRGEEQKTVTKTNNTLVKVTANTSASTKALDKKLKCSMCKTIPNKKFGTGFHKVAGKWHNIVTCRCKELRVIST